MGFSHVIKHSALDVVVAVAIAIADDMTHWEFICAQPANAFSHTHTEIFFGFARDFLSYFLFGFFKSDAKLLRWGINQSNAGTTRNAHKEQHQQQQ